MSYGVIEFIPGYQTKIQLEKSPVFSKANMDDACGTRDSRRADYLPG